MNRDSSRLLLCTFAAAAVVVTATDASAFPNPFKRKPVDAPLAPSELQASENTAGGLLKQAQDLEAAGKSGAAASTYKKIVTNYPLTSFAPVAQFRLASTYERDGKFSKAFDTYQELVETYKQSAQFGEAIDRQMAIAMQSRTEKLGSFLGIAKKLDPTEQLDMFQKVINSAPRGRRAAEAQFEIAKIHEEEKDEDAAIAAYRKVVEDYPSSPLAPDAQSKIGETYLGKVEGGSRDSANIAKARAAAEEASGLFPNKAVANLDSTRSQVADLAADNAWKTAKFYEKSGNPKAALLYYSDVMRSPGNSHVDAARERISAITAANPQLADSLPKLSISPKDLAIRAAVDTKNQANYFGPPAPGTKVAGNTPGVERARMRDPRDQIPSIQLEEPDLPTGSDPVLKPDNTLLNPTLPPSGNPPPAAPAPGDSGELKPGDAVPVPTEPAPEPPSLTPPTEPTLPPPSEPSPAPSEPAPTPPPAEPSKP